MATSCEAKQASQPFPLQQHVCSKRAVAPVTSFSLGLLTSRYDDKKLRQQLRGSIRTNRASCEPGSDSLFFSFDHLLAAFGLPFTSGSSGTARLCIAYTNMHVLSGSAPSRCQKLHVQGLQSLAWD